MPPLPFMPRPAALIPAGPLPFRNPLAPPAAASLNSAVEFRPVGLAIHLSAPARRAYARINA